MKRGYSVTIKFLGPTNHRPPRLSGKDSSGKTKIVEWSHRQTTEQNLLTVCRYLLDQYGEYQPTLKKPIYSRPTEDTYIVMFEYL